MDFELQRNEAGYIQWRDEQINYIISEYESKRKTIASLRREFSCNAWTITNILQKNNVHLYSYEERYPRNKTFFKDIDTHEKAYWLGVMFADGTVSSETSQKPKRIELGMIDGEHIEKFRKAIGATNTKITKLVLKNENARPFFHIAISDADMRNDLIRHGCIPRKSWELCALPDLTDELFWDFMRGYFDGDGCLRIDSNHKHYSLFFVSGSKEFLTALKDRLGVQHLTIGRPHPNRENFSLAIGRYSDVLRILQNMYQHSTSETRLDRKYKKYLEFCKHYEIEQKEVA